MDFNNKYIKIPKDPITKEDYKQLEKAKQEIKDNNYLNNIISYPKNNDQ